MREIIKEDGRKFIEEDFGNIRGEILSIQKSFSKDGVLQHEVMLRNNQQHGVSKVYSTTQNGFTDITMDVHFNGASITPQPFIVSEEVFIHKLEDFFLKNALEETLGVSPFSEDDSLLLPLLRRADDLEDVFKDLMLKGLDSNYILEAGLVRYDWDRNKDLYFKFFDIFESGEYDMYKVAQRFMEGYSSKTFPDVMVSEALSQDAELMIGTYKEELQKTLDLYIPQLSTEILGWGLNYLETHRSEIKDSIENEYNSRHQKMQQVHSTKITAPSPQKGRRM